MTFGGRSARDHAHRRQPHTAEAVARRLGVDEVRADVLPDQKAEEVKRLQAEGRVVAMAGDGVNDAPALAQADVGIAMGTGTDVAIESAGITLIKGDLRGIVRARRLSRATMTNIRQNLVFAFLYNALGVPIAAGVLYPCFGILLSPMIASLAMTLSSVSVIVNALRLRAVKPLMNRPERDSGPTYREPVPSSRLHPARLRASVFCRRSTLVCGRRLRCRMTSRPGRSRKG